MTRSGAVEGGLGGEGGRGGCALQNIGMTLIACKYIYGYEARDKRDFLWNLTTKITLFPLISV